MFTIMAERIRVSGGFPVGWETYHDCEYPEDAIGDFGDPDCTVAARGVFFAPAGPVVLSMKDAQFWLPRVEAAMPDRYPDDSGLKLCIVSLEEAMQMME